MSSKVDKQELANYLEELKLDSNNTAVDVTRALMNNFDLPEPVIKQTMIIELHIPVTNMNKLGDTYTYGCDKIRELMKNADTDTASARIIGKIEMVDIVPAL